MARFSLSSHPWELIFVYRVHNSTVARQLRYTLTKERLCCRTVTPAAYVPYAVAEIGEDVCAPTGNLPPAEVLPKERLAQRLRYCRIMPLKRRNAPAWTPGQGETAPWTARFDGFVKHRNPKKHNLYSTLAA